MYKSIKTYTPSDKTNQRFWSKVAITADPDRCWLWLRSLGHGYGAFWFAGETRQAQKVAWILVNGRWPTLSILHSCDNRACCNPKHLREGTQAENMNDMKLRGRSLLGERNPNSKLTAEEVKIIKIRKRHLHTTPSLATEFGVSAATIGAIRQGRIWKNV